MQELLRQAGFRLRNKRRADCAHCKGHSTGTVSFTDEVAYCHRCGWRSSKGRLEAELRGPRLSTAARQFPKGLRFCRGQNQALPPVKRSPSSGREAQAMAAAFQTWLNETLHAIGMRERQLYWAKRRASACLAMRSDDPTVWDALIALSDEEDWLDALWDFLSGERTSRWWNPRVSAEEIFLLWRAVQRTLRSAAALPPPGSRSPASREGQAALISPTRVFFRFGNERHARQSLAPNRRRQSRRTPQGCRTGKGKSR